MSKEIRVVLAGCGGMSRRWLEIVQELPGVEIVGLVDIELEAAEKRAEDFELGEVVLTTELEDALKKAEPDVVFDCTVPEAHVDITLTALDYGCHVLGEKPLADSMENARRMVAKAQKEDRIYAVIQNRRYDPNIRRLQNFLSEGGIGRITTVNSDFYIGAHFDGFRRRMKHVLLLDMAIHTFDAARLISGAKPEGVFCREWNPVGSWYDHDASAMAIFDMSDGIKYNYRGSWCAEGMNTTWEAEWRIVGDRGTVLWDGGQNFEAEVVEDADGFISKHRTVEIPTYDNPAKTGGHAGVIQEFIDCVRTGRTPETVCSDNIESLAMVFGAITSAEQNEYIDINAIMNS